MKTLIAAAAAVAVSAPAFAINGQLAPTDIIGANADNVRLLDSRGLAMNGARTIGGAIDTALAAFGPGGGAGIAIVDDAAVNAITSVADPFGRPDVTVDTIIVNQPTGNPNEFDLIIEWSAFDNVNQVLVPLLPQGALVGGGIVDQLQFDFGGPGISGGSLQGDGALVIPGLASIVSEVSILFDSAAGTLATSSPGAVVANGNDIEGAVVWSAGGADLSTLDIAGNAFVITYTVIPAPGAAGLLGLAGLAAARRRR